MKAIFYPDYFACYNKSCVFIIDMFLVYPQNNSHQSGDIKFITRKNVRKIKNINNCGALQCVEVEANLKGYNKSVFKKISP